jgi:ABC-2 family transporter
MNRMMAIIEREMRKFFRSPALMMASMVMPLVQLIVLGNAFGGKIRDAKMGVVDEDHGTQAIRIQEAFDAIHANMRTFVSIPYDNEVKAREDVRNGKIQGALIIPAQYSKMVYEKNHPRIALIVDNSDNVMSGAFDDELIEPAGRVAATVAANGAGGGGALSLYRVHEVSAAGVNYAGDVRIGDDRRGNAVYRRQGARRT